MTCAGWASSGTKEWRRGAAYGPYRQTERMQSCRPITHGACSLRVRAITAFAPLKCYDAHRKAQLAAGLPPKYAGTCRNIPLDEASRRKENGEAAVIRLRVPEGRHVTFNDVVRGEVTFHTDVIGDPVLVRSDGIPAYNFAVVIDDALMKVTHVIRGEDHISNTPRQILLYEAYGYQPPTFAHLSLVMGPDHAPLSKRHGATSVREFREKGYLPEALVNYLALIGWSPRHNEELLPADELARRFRLENVAHSAGVFDEDKLAWANRHYLKVCDPDRLATLAEPYLRKRGQIVGDLSAGARAWLVNVLPGMAASVDRLPQLADRLESVFQFQVAAEPIDANLAKALAEELPLHRVSLTRKRFEPSPIAPRNAPGSRARTCSIRSA